jgi:hypothetical protein
VLLGGQDLVAKENDSVFAKGIADLGQRGFRQRRRQIDAANLGAPTAVESGSIRM